MTYLDLPEPSFSSSKQRPVRAPPSQIKQPCVSGLWAGLPPLSPLGPLPDPSTPTSQKLGLLKQVPPELRRVLTPPTHTGDIKGKPHADP